MIIIVIIIPFLISPTRTVGLPGLEHLMKLFIHSCDCWLVSGMSQRDTLNENEGRSSSSSSSDCAAG